jgi:hypothetical protein
MLCAFFVYTGCDSVLEGLESPVGRTSGTTSHPKIKSLRHQTAQRVKQHYGELSDDVFGSLILDWVVPCTQY